MTAYATVDEYIAWTAGDDAASGTSAERARYQLLLDGAASAINEAAHRSFYVAGEGDAVSGARAYPAHAGDRYLRVDDFTGSATVTIDGTAATATAEPASRGRPFTTLRLADAVPDDDAVISVLATWGWDETPEPIQIANLLLASKVAQRRQSPSGIERGNDEIGFIRILGVDRDVIELVRPFKRAARLFA